MACTIPSHAQTGLAISFPDLPTRTENKYGIDLLFNVSVNEIALMQEFVVDVIEPDGKTKNLRRLPIVYRDSTYYLDGQQSIHHGSIQFFTGFNKYQISNRKLIFYGVDKSGNKSNSIAYQLNP
jgi:hypothetical protein